MPDYIKEAHRAKREGDFSKAGDLFYLGGDYKRAMAMYLKGNHFALAARLLEKNEDWKKAAELYVQAGKHAEAAEIYSSRLKDYRTASLMFANQGNLPKASEMAEKAGDLMRAALLADQAELWERAASLYLHTRKYERAADIYYKIVHQISAEHEEKSYWETHRSLLGRYANTAGALFMRLKNFEKAAECYQKSENFQKMAEALALAGNKEKAAEVFYRIQQYKKAYDLLQLLGERCEDKKLFADVCFNLKKFEQAGELYLLIGHVHRAAEAFEGATIYYKAAMLFESLEDYSKAAELFLKMDEPVRAAELYEKSKNFDVAARLYEQIGLSSKAIECLVLSGQHIKAANLLVAKKDFSKAISVLQQITKENDDYHAACILLGQLFSNLEMHAVALQKFTEATAGQPINRDNLDIYYSLALAYEKSAHYSKAREIYEKLLSIQLDYKDVYQRLSKLKTLNLLDGVTAEATPSSVKRVLASRYELIEKIGRDSFGILYKGHDTSLDRPVLVRRMPEQDTNITRSILEQTRIVSGLTHSNILSIYDSGKDEDHYFICMEYVEGHTLRQTLSRGPLEISDVCEFASQICLALSYAHKKNFIHKNLSPENIYVCPGNQIKLTNFGIDAKWEKGNTLVSKQYFSPEQLMGEKVDARTDIYSFGILLYEMIYGKAPFAGQDVELQHLKQAPNFPENALHPAPSFLIKIIQKCLRKEKRRRYPSSDDILEELEIADIVPGMLFDNRYEILREIGTGGMGRVYQAKDRELDEIVALKVLRAEVSADPLIQRRFVREIKVARMITHPNVVKVFDIGKYKGNRYISMEFIQGVSLDEWLKKNKTADIRLLLTFLAKIIQGVHAAHLQGIIHRDLKPQNVLLDPTMNPRVLDFGIARSKDHVDATSSGQVLGSPKYMSTEQIQGKEIDKRSDIYSMGVIMFLIFTGEEPFTGDDPRSIIMKHLTQSVPSMKSINPAVPDWLEKIVQKCMEKDRNQRYSSLKDVLDELKKGYETQKYQGEK